VSAFAVDSIEAAAFDLRPAGMGSRAPVARAVLCLHGLTATPYEVRPVADALVARGFRALGPLLPGHGTQPQQLAQTGWEAWLAAARAAHAELRARHERVFVAGISMGGLLALALAAEQPVAGVAAIATPLDLRLPPDSVIALGSWIRPFLSKRHGPDIRDPAARARHPTYPVMPLAAVRQLIRLQRYVSENLARVRAPMLAAHGAHDRTANPADLDRLIAAVASQRKERVWLEEAGHVATVDFGGRELAARIADFFDAID
jgi:carboxylesterase